MVQDIRKEHDVKRCILEGKARPIEKLNRNISLCARQNVNSAETYIRSPSLQDCGYRAVTASYIQYTGGWRKHLRKPPGEHIYATV
ncbi:MAG: hypothetical protein WAN03_12775 [Candidatus Sulfotelmatobacter sp.]